MKLVMMKGLPASGKSTYAKKLVEEQGYKRINRDDLRAMIDSSKWSKSNEKLIVSTRDFLIKQYLSAGYNVVVDDTNLSPNNEKDLRAIADMEGADFWVEFIDTPIDECIRRDSKRDNTVGEKVIRDMYNKFMKKDESFKYYPTNRSLTDCIIVDIDGTLAEKGDRDIYDGSKVYLDKVIRPVNVILDTIKNSILYYDIILVSGRDSKHRDVTEKRLKDNGIFYNALFMRDEGDNRDDVIVKTELREKYIKDKYNVLFAIDDRRKVVDNWRKLGIFTFDVNQTRSIF